MKQAMNQAMIGARARSRGKMTASICKKLVPLLAVVSLSGCVSLGGEVPDQMISLTPQVRVPAGEIGSGAMGDALVVLDPDADRRLDVARVPVQIDDSAVAYLEKATWVEKPARQFRRLLAETLRAKGGRIVSEGSDHEITGKTRLAGRLVDMGYDAREQAVVVRYDAVLEGEGGKVRSRRFEATVHGVAAKAESVGRALNRAANQVAGEVAAWVTGG